MKDPQTGRMVDDYWEASKKMLMEDDFLHSLRTYDKDHIDQGIIKRIKVCFGDQAGKCVGGCIKLFHLQHCPCIMERAKGCSQGQAALQQLVFPGVPRFCISDQQIIFLVLTSKARRDGRLLGTIQSCCPITACRLRHGVMWPSGKRQPPCPLFTPDLC